MSHKKKFDELSYDSQPSAEYWNPHLCPVCGNNNFIWGKVHEAHNSFAKLRFRPDDAGIFESSKEIAARHCTRCGNLQLFSEKPS